MKLAGRVAALFTGLLVAYVLSIGPVVLYVESIPSNTERLQKSQALQVFYTPLGAFCEKCPAVAHPLEDYVNLWLDFPQHRRHP